jgi:hypothetical protein
MNAIAKKLKSDPNKNVNSLFIDIEVLPSDIEIENIPMNQLFVNKMTVLKTEFGISKNLPIDWKTRNEPVETSVEATIKASIMKDDEMIVDSGSINDNEQTELINHDDSN